MPGDLTEITEITTALGMLAPDLATAIAHRPVELTIVQPRTWERLVAAHGTDQHTESFVTAFENGRAFLAAVDGLRGRRPLVVEWKGSHRPPGDDVIPADLRIDHVFLVSCKYLSKVLLNPGPARLFERLLVGDERSSVNWFVSTAPIEFQALYTAARSETALHGLPLDVNAVTRDQQLALKTALNTPRWPTALAAPWANLCEAVAAESAVRWKQAAASARDQVRLLWRLLRISTASYFVLGTDRTAHLRLRVDSAWDWTQAYELRGFDVTPRSSGQPEVAWRALVRRRSDRLELTIDGHVEIRWSHGRTFGPPEAKVYLDTPLRQVPGYNTLV